jgi:hypothetical protein
MAMDTCWASLSRQASVSELDEVERAIARSRAIHVFIDSAGRTGTRVSPQLLALAERST